MENGDSNRSIDRARTARHATHHEIREILEKLTHATALISIVIKGELAGSTDRDLLDRLYTVKGGLTCAIEELEKQLL